MMPVQNKKKIAQEAVNPAQSLEAAKIAARRLAEATPDSKRLQLARSFCLQLTGSWWADLTQSDQKFLLRDFIEPISDLPDLSDSAMATAETIGRAFSSLDPETAVYSIGMIYTSMLPQAYRSSYGVFYTPPQLTARLIDQATVAGVDWATCRVLDPACGGGAFLAPVARRILDSLPNVTPSILVKNIASRLRGFEIDPFAAWLSQVTLEAVMLPICRKARQRLPLVVTICDSLKSELSCEKFDLVIGNPPYGRVTLPASERERFSRSLFGHANLYGLFTDLALSYTKTNGIVAFVTPTSFLAGEYFKNLRTLLGTDAHPMTIDFVSCRKGVFDEVLQETVLVTYKRGVKKASAEVFEVIPSPETSLKITATGTFVLPDNISLPWLLPRSKQQAKLITQLGKMTHRLSDWGYHVSTGPLVWNRFKPQLQNRAGKGRVPLIWAESITSDGTFIFRADKRNHQPFFTLKSGDDWLITRKPCVLLQRTTAKEQNRRLIAAAIPTSFLAEHKAVVIENHINMVLPTKDMPEVSPEVLAVFLNSGAADRAFRCVSGSVAVSAYELESLPLPDPKKLKELATLVKRKASRKLIEAECDALFESKGKA